VPRRRSRVAVIVAVVFAAGLTGCAASMAGGEHSMAWPPPEDEPRKFVWLTRHGFHTRIAVRRADVDPQLWPESREFADTDHLEVGWGDRDFYPKPHPSIWDTIDTVIRRTPAALHVGGFHPPPEEFLPGKPIVRIAVSARGFDRLTRFIHEHYARDESGEPVRIRPGYYERSWFYQGAGRYNALFRNSNNWAAEALRVAGVPTDPRSAVTAGAVVAQARQFGD